MKFIPTFIILIILFTSCGSIKPDAPDLPRSQISSTPLPDSKIDVPITIDLTQVLNDFNSRVPAEFSGDGAAGPGQYRWDIKRKPFNVSLSGDSLHITDAAHFTGGGYLKIPFTDQLKKICGCESDVTIGIGAKLDLLSNYSLPGNARLTQFDLSACNLNIGNFDITPVIKPRAVDAINNALVGLNQKIKQYNFRSLLQPALTALNQPIKIADLGYVNINPSAVRIGKPSATGNLLNLTAGITAKPVFYLADPGKNPATTIPDISKGNGSNGFNLNMDLHLDYKPMNDILKDKVNNQKITDGTNGYMIIQGTEIYGSGNDHLLIKVTFSGKKTVPIHGILYFTCIPVYDINTGNLYISDINFAVGTIKKLQEGPAAWILGSALKKYLGTEVHFNVGDQITGVKAKLNQALNGQAAPHIFLTGKVDSLSVQGILPVKDYILVRLNTSGKLAIKIN
jgi:hypothetical protein